MLSTSAFPVLLAKGQVGCNRAGRLWAEEAGIAEGSVIFCSLCLPQTILLESDGYESTQAIPE